MLLHPAASKGVSSGGDGVGSKGGGGHLDVSRVKSRGDGNLLGAQHLWKPFLPGFAHRSHQNSVFYNSLANGAVQKWCSTPDMGLVAGAGRWHHPSNCPQPHVVQAQGSISSIKAEQSDVRRFTWVCVVLIGGEHQTSVMEMLFARVVTLAVQGCQEQGAFLHCILSTKPQWGYFAYVALQPWKGCDVSHIPSHV